MLATGYPSLNVLKATDMMTKHDFARVVELGNAKAALHCLRADMTQIVQSFDNELQYFASKYEPKQVKAVELSGATAMRQEFHKEFFHICSMWTKPVHMALWVREVYKQGKMIPTLQAPKELSRMLETSGAHLFERFDMSSLASPPKTPELGRECGRARSVAGDADVERESPRIAAQAPSKKPAGKVSGKTRPSTSTMKKSTKAVAKASASSSNKRTSVMKRPAKSCSAGA